MNESINMSFLVIKMYDIQVNVDKGMEDGQKITFSEEGDQEPGLEPGDIMIVLDEKQHDSICILFQS